MSLATYHGLQKRSLPGRIARADQLRCSSEAPQGEARPIVSRLMLSKGAEIRAHFQGQPAEVRSFHLLNTHPALDP